MFKQVWAEWLSHIKHSEGLPKVSGTGWHRKVCPDMLRQILLSPWRLLRWLMMKGTYYSLEVSVSSISEYIIFLNYKLPVDLHSPLWAVYVVMLTGGLQLGTLWKLVLSFILENQKFCCFAERLFRQRSAKILLETLGVFWSSSLRERVVYWTWDSLLKFHCFS